MLKTDSFTKKQKYSLGIIALIVIVIISLVAAFSDVLVDKPEENSTLFYVDELKSESKTDATYTLGSTKEEVLVVQGKPTNVVGESWYYGASIIDFAGDTVVAYSDRKGILDIELKPKVSSDKTYFELGLTKDEVLTVQGKPSNIVGKYWYFGSSKVEFENDIVVAYSDRNRLLNVKPKLE